MYPANNYHRTPTQWGQVDDTARYEVLYRSRVAQVDSLDKYDNDGALNYGPTLFVTSYIIIVVWVLLQASRADASPRAGRWAPPAANPEIRSRARNLKCCKLTRGDVRGNLAHQGGFL